MRFNEKFGVKCVFIGKKLLYQACNFPVEITVFLLRFIRERVVTSQMEILEGEKAWGERREGEEKTYPRIAQCFKCLPKHYKTPLKSLIQTWT